MSDKVCGLRWSAQHLLGVYSQESRSPKFFAGVDLDVARSCPVMLRLKKKTGTILPSLSGAGGVDGICTGERVPVSLRQKLEKTN
jgi:hypothetical protein